MRSDPITITVLLVCTAQPAQAADEVVIQDRAGETRARITEVPGGGIDLYDARSNRTGYGVQRPDGSVDLFRPDGSRLGVIQPERGGQPSRLLLPKGKR